MCKKPNTVKTALKKHYLKIVDIYPLTHTYNMISLNNKI